MSFRECALTYRIHKRADGVRRTRCANHADTTLPCGGGDGNDGFGGFDRGIFIGGHNGSGGWMWYRLAS